MSDQEQTIDHCAPKMHFKQEIEAQVHLSKRNCFSSTHQHHTLNSTRRDHIRDKQHSVFQDNDTVTSTFILELQKRPQRMTSSYQMGFRGISKTLSVLIAFIFLHYQFILEADATTPTVQRPKITYNSLDEIQPKQNQAPISKAICSGDSTHNAGVMSLTYTFSVDWEPTYSPQTIIFNVEESLIEALSSRLLSCDQRHMIRRSLQQRRNTQGYIKTAPTRKTGIIAIDATPEDVISELSTCPPKVVSNKCAVVHGTISLFLEEDADLDLVRYLSRSAILDSMEDADTVEKTKGVTNLTYLGPSFNKPESMVKNSPVKETKKETSMKTTSILIIVGSCSAITVLGTILFVIRTQRHKHKNMRPLYDFDESQGNQPSVKKQWINTSQNLTDVADSVQGSLQDESWDDDQEGLSVIMEATHEASTKGGSSIQVSTAGWTTDEDSTVSYNQNSVVSGFSNLSTFT